MSEKVCRQPLDDGGAADDGGPDGLRVDPLRGEIRWSAADLADCPTEEEELQRGGR